MRKQAVIRVSGQVQGVSFRWETQSLARGLGLVGWVRNEPDGSVKIVAQGEESKLEKLIDWVYHGPASARIEKTEVNWLEPEEKFSDFSIKS